MPQEAEQTPEAMPQDSGAASHDEQRYRQFPLEDLAGGFTATPNGRLIECNAAFAEIYRLPPPTEVAQYDVSRFNPADWTELVRQVQEQGKVRGYTSWQRRHDGTKVFIVANVVGRFDDEGKMIEVRGSLFDDTERGIAARALEEANERLRTQAEDYAAQNEQLLTQREELLIQAQELHESREQAQHQAKEVEWLARVLEGNPHPVLCVSINGGILYRNAAAAALDRLWYGADGRKAGPSIQQIVSAAYAHEEPIHRERAFGNRIYTLTAVAVQESGYVNIYFHDITARRQAENALRVSHQKYRTLFESIDEGYCIVEVLFDRTGRAIDFRFVEVNAAFEKQTGIEDAVGRRMREFAPDLEDRWFEICGYVVRTGKSMRFPNPARALGRLYDVYVFRVGKLERQWVAILLNDITERKREEETVRSLNVALERRVAERTAELEQRARQLAELTLELSQAEDRERRRMADILHDDLQQQLAAMKFHVSLLNTRARHDPSQQAIAARLDEMLKEAVETSRSLSHDLSPATLYQNDLGQTFAWLARQTQERHGLIVRVETRGSVSLESDPVKAFLYKAGQELLFNVVKHARTDEAVIRLRRFRGYVCLSVADRGHGFDPRERKETVGFGLFSIRERVELLGGHMKIRSAPGKGSTVLVVVPDRPLEQAPGRGREASNAAPDSERESPDSGPRLRVLVADDHAVVRQGLTALLRETPGLEMAGEAANGREAIDLAVQLEPDVVIMDVTMPLIDGDLATRQIRRYLPRVRVIALSMHDEPGMMQRMRQAGAEAYILKTAPAKDLVAAIRGD